MLFWIVAITITAIACAALYYASLRKAVNASEMDVTTATTDHHRQQLADIEKAVATARLTEAEAVAAKGELAREVLRLQAEAPKPTGDGGKGARQLLPLAILGIAIVSFGTYGFIGNPEIPAQPLAARATQDEGGLDLAQAVAAIEARLAETPDDVRGWEVIAPVYLQTARYDDAVRAYRRIYELTPVTADSQTNLAQALILQNGGTMTPEAQTLLADAVASDASAVRPRFYLASEATRLGRFEEAVGLWTALLALGSGTEEWYQAAQGGLNAARAGEAGASTGMAPVDPAQQEMIRAMVSGLAQRLDSEGGTLEEWTQLVRARLVLGETEAAQAAYDAAKIAYPSITDRADLDTMALQAGLK